MRQQWTLAGAFGDCNAPAGDTLTLGWAKASVTRASQTDSRPKPRFPSHLYLGYPHYDSSLTVYIYIYIIYLYIYIYNCITTCVVLIKILLLWHISQRVLWPVYLSGPRAPCPEIVSRTGDTDAISMWGHVYHKQNQKMISITRLMQVQNKNGFKIQFTTRKLCFGKTVRPLRHRLPTSNRPSGLRFLQSLHSKVDPELVLACGTAL